MSSTSRPLRLEVAHEVPGRIRLRCPELQERPELGAELERLSRELPGFDSVKVRPATRSVVVEYSLEDTDPATFRQALEARAEIVPAPPAPPAPDWDRPVGAVLTREVRRLWHEADVRLLQATDGRLDMHSSVPWILLVLSLRQILAAGLAPLPWYTAFYYSIQAILREGSDSVPGEPVGRRVAVGRKQKAEGRRQ